MKLLLMQCLRGTEIGQIKIEQINRDGFFYYSYRSDNKNNINFEKNEKILFMQYNAEKECCGIAIGKYNSLIFESTDKKTIKIEKILPIINKDKEIEYSKSAECQKVIDIIKEIKSALVNKDILDSNITHSISEIEMDEDKFEVLNNLVRYSNSNEEEKKYLKEMLRLYNKFEKSHKLDSETGIDDDKKMKLEKIFRSYDKLERKETLGNLAQKSIYAQRVENKGEPRENRTEYQRDWERIIHSKSFRRLEDKAQIYTLAKGDHFRTRLTHTLEVAQIARGIARELNLNEDLVEAIALGHDLGHTPFGHSGERTLNKILKDEKVEGGFKHNFQGVKVVNYLEEKYGEFEGIDLTYQVMEGILKHTKISDCKECSKYSKEKKTCNDLNLTEALRCDNNPYQIKKFLCKGDIEKLHLKYNFSTTLEGQVVAVADEIAQRAHDLDDGIASGIIKEEDFLAELKKEECFKKLNDSIEKSLRFIDDDKRDYIDKLDIKRARIISDVITYFIKEIVDKSIPIIEEKEKQIGDMTNKTELLIDEEIIKFHDEIEIVRDRLDQITSRKVINSKDVKRFDGEGEYVIQELYKAYYEKPIERMPPNTLKRILRETNRYMNDVIDISEGKKEDIESNIVDLINDEINIYKNRNPKNDMDKIKHKIFVRSIIDFISGMTDEFAIKQFKEIYIPITY